MLSAASSYKCGYRNKKVGNFVTIQFSPELLALHTYTQNKNYEQLPRTVSYDITEAHHRVILVLPHVPQTGQHHKATYSRTPTYMVYISESHAETPLM